MPDWDNLKYVLETVRQGGVGSAARHLGVNQTTIVRRIKAAEAELGCKLFRQRQHGYTATKEGLFAAEAGRKIEQELSALESHVGGLQKKMVGSLTITAPPLLIEKVLSPILVQFRQKYPELLLRIRATTQLEKIQNGDVDVAIRVTQSPPVSLFGIRVCGHYAATYVSVENAELLRNKKAVFLNKVELTTIERRFQQHAFLGDLSQIICVDDPTSACGLIRSGAGVGCLPCFVGDADPSLKRLPGSSPVRFADLWILTHQDLKQAQKVRNFITFVRQALRAQSTLKAV